MFKIEQNTTALDNIITINGSEFRVSDTDAEAIYNICIGKATTKASKPYEKPTTFQIGYHIEKYNNLYLIVAGDEAQFNGKYYKDAYKLRYVDGAKDLVKSWISALPNIKTTTKTFTDKNGKDRTYTVYGYSKKADAEQALATLPTSK